jgi:SAM-dependent methyltransferase
MTSTSPRQTACTGPFKRWNSAGFSAIGSSTMNSAPQVFDRALYIDRQHSASGEALTLLHQRVSEELSDRLMLINRSFEQTLLIAPQAAHFAKDLGETGKCGAIECRAPVASDNLNLPTASCNAIISLLDLHGVNDVPGYMAQVSNALEPDGLALFAFFAGETLRELREAWLHAEQQLTGGASPRVAPMIDLREAGGLLQRAGLALPVADVDRASVRYPDAMSLMREVKKLGFNNCLSGRTKHFTTPSLVMQAAMAYPADADGRITATIEIAWAAAWKPHPSQQQPLKPGSAKARLADALKVDEGKL